jgi:hypothetical protein
VANGGTAEGSAGDGGSDLVDVVNKLGGFDTRTSVGLGTDDRVTVEIFTADGDTDDEVSEGIAVCGDGRLEGSDLVAHVTTGSPETKEKSGLLLDGSRDGRDGAVGCATLNHGVQTGTSEGIVGSDEVLSSRELGLEVTLGLKAAIDLEGTVVETLRDGLGGGDGHREGKELSGTHFECFNECW